MSGIEWAAIVIGVACGVPVGMAAGRRTGSVTVSSGTAAVVAWAVCTLLVQVVA